MRTGQERTKTGALGLLYQRGQGQLGDEQGAPRAVRGKPGDRAVWKPSEECTSQRKAWPAVPSATDRSRRAPRPDIQDVAGSLSLS